MAMSNEGPPETPERTNLLGGYCDADRERLTQCFDRLFPHLTAGKFALTGGIDIVCQLSQRGMQVPGWSPNDIDFVAESMDVVHAAVTENFLVSHYHPPQPGYDKFLIQLVDPVSRLRIDTFPYLSSSPTRSKAALLGNWEISLVAVEDLFVRKIALVQDLSASNKIDPKHYEHIGLLETMADMEVASAIWDASLKGKYLYSLVDAVRKHHQLQNEHPEWVRKERYAQLGTPACGRCRASGSFPLASKGDVFDVLGYV